MVVGLAVICDNCYQMHEEGAKLPGGGAIVPNVAKAAGAQSCGQCRHHQALVGAERARVGIPPSRKALYGQVGLAFLP